MDTEARSLDFKLSNALEPFDKLPLKPLWSHHESERGAWKSHFTGFRHLTYPPNQEGYPEPCYEWRELNWLEPANNWRLIVSLLYDYGCIFEEGQIEIPSADLDVHKSQTIDADRDRFAERVLDAFCRVKGIA